MYGIIYTVHVPLCSIHFLISLIDKKSSFPMLYNPTFLYTFVFSISWLLNPAMYAYKYRLAFLSETNRWLSINYQTKKVCHFWLPPFYYHIIFATRIAYLPSLYHILYSHTIFPAFISSFPSYSEKNIYLCHTLSAHQRDETGKSGFLFLNGVNNVLSLKLKN